MTTKREIRFRVWGKNLKIMSHVLEMKLGADWIANGLSVFNDDEAVLLQSSGLKDKNDRDIYEGDIVVAIAQDEFPDNTTISDIFYSPETAFSVRSGNYHHGLSLTWGGWKTIEVIGNIYQNPKLLKGRNDN